MRNLKKNITTIIFHSVVNILPFIFFHLISPFIKYRDCEFLYLVSHRNFWYIWLIPLMLIIFKRYRRTHIFTACTTTAMFMAQYFGDIRYRKELIKAQQGNYYPHANHFGLWLKYTLELTTVCILLYCFINRRKIFNNINNLQTGGIADKPSAKLFAFYRYI